VIKDLAQLQKETLLAEMKIGIVQDCKVRQHVFRYASVINGDFEVLC